MTQATTAVQTGTEEVLAPARLHRIMTAYLEAKAIFSGIELGLFEALEKSPDTIEGLSKRLKLQERPLRILLTALRGVGLGLVERVDGQFRNTKWASAFLVSSSPQYLGDFAMHQNVHFAHFARLTDALRENRSITGRVRKAGYSNEGAGSGEDRDSGIRRFIQALHGSAMLQAELLTEKVDLTGCRHLADLGCGSAAYSITFAKAYPELRVTSMDYAAVCEVAREYVEAAGVSDRVTFKPGNIFKDPLPEGCDAVLLSHVLDGYGREQAALLLRRIYDWMPKGKQLYLHAHLPSRAKVNFPFSFGLILLVNTEEGEVHDEEDITQWLTQAGFRELAVEVVSPLSAVFRCRK